VNRLETDSEIVQLTEEQIIDTGRHLETAKFFLDIMYCLFLITSDCVRKIH